MHDTHFIKHLVVSGGGVRGYATLGALDYLDKHNIIDIPKIRTFAGSSIGAIICLLLVCKYSPRQIYDDAAKLDLTSMFEPDIQNLLVHFGFDTGVKFVAILRSLMEKNGFDPDITFLRLYNVTKQKLIITATSLNKRAVKYFDYIQTPNYKVIDVVRASMGIPILFTTVKDTNNISGEHEHFVDGGLLDNFPLHLFAGVCNANEILAIKFKKTKDRDPNQQFTQINSLDEVIIANITCLLEEIEHLRSLLSKDLYNKSTILIDTHEYHMLALSITDKDKRKLLKMGKQSAKNYVSSPTYVLLRLSQMNEYTKHLVWKYVHDSKLRLVHIELLDALLE